MSETSETIRLSQHDYLVTLEHLGAAWSGGHDPNAPCAGHGYPMPRHVAIASAIRNARLLGQSWDIVRHVIERAACLGDSGPIHGPLTFDAGGAMVPGATAYQCPACFSEAAHEGACDECKNRTEGRTS